MRGAVIAAAVAVHLLCSLPAPGRAETPATPEHADLVHESDFAPGSSSLAVLPEDGREIYFRAIDRARRDIRIEICVLEDPQILRRLQAALQRGVRVRVIVDRGKYSELPAERPNLAQYLTSAGGELHLSNPIFPRSFPKIILIDSHLVIYGSACLDQTTFSHYRDFAHATTDPLVVRELHRLFENDWAHSATVGTGAAGVQPDPAALPVQQPDRLPGQRCGAARAALPGGAADARRLHGASRQRDAGERAGRGGQPRRPGAPDLARSR